MAGVIGPLPFRCVCVRVCVCVCVCGRVVGGLKDSASVRVNETPSPVDAYVHSLRNLLCFPPRRRRRVSGQDRAPHS